MRRPARGTKARRAGPAPAERVLAKAEADARGQLAFLKPLKIPGVKPGMPRQVALLNELRARAHQVGQHFGIILRIADEMIAYRYYEPLGFDTMQDLFERRVPHLSWPTVRRYLVVLDAIRRLPEGQREAAMEELQGVGITKAAIIAPVIGRPGEPWAKWLKLARDVGEDGLRGAVQGTLDRQAALPGTAASPATKAADQKWLDHTLHILNGFAPDAAAEVKEVFDAGKKALGATSYFSVFLSMCKEVKIEWAHGASPAERATG